MSYQRIRWLILLLPTVVIGFWEYIRHEFLLPYISMNLGNWLSPFIVLLATLTISRKLFTRYEQLQKQLEDERAEKAVFQERERIARELHDGIAQTLFLCSVQIDLLQRQHSHIQWDPLKNNLQQIHNYVRHSITTLKERPPLSSMDWKKQVDHVANELQEQIKIPITTKIQIHEDALTAEERIQLLDCIREALTNIRKHAHRANYVLIHLFPTQSGWRLEIEDDGEGFEGDPLSQPERFGLKMMRDRAREINAQMKIQRIQGKTRVSIEKED